jgi:hypothetical protein
MKTPTNSNFRRTSSFNRQIETSKPPNLQNPQIIKTPKIEIPFHAQILAPDLVLAPRLHPSLLTPINFQQTVSSNFELF